MKLSAKEFDKAVNRAIKRIPREFRNHLKNILISVRKRPSAEMLATMDLPEGYPLLGLYVGSSLMERSATAPPLYPDTILIFQEPLEGMCRSSGELERQIEITVVHEIAHFLGIDDDRLEELGYE